MTLYAWLHFIHVLGAIAWLGGGLMITVTGLRARSQSDARVITEFAKSLPDLGPRVLLPGTVIVPVTGVWMVLISSGWKLTQLWVVLALGLFVLAFLIGVLQVGRIGVQLGKAANPAPVLNQWLFWYGVVLVVLVATVWDMVFKPGL